MAYSFFPNDFQNLPNLQDQLFLMKQKQAAALNEANLGSEKQREAYNARPMPTLIPPAGTLLPSPMPKPESKVGPKPKPKPEPKPTLIPPAGTLLPSPMPKPESKVGPKPEPKPRKGDIKEPGGIAGGLGIPPETPRKPGRGVTKSGKIITITDPGFTNTSGKIDGSGRRNVNRDKDGNVHITYGISGPPEGMSSGGEDYVHVGDDFDDKTSNPTEYYNTKSKQREADRATMFQRRPEDTPRYIN